MSTETSATTPSAVSLDEVITTGELEYRSKRLPNFEAEAQALGELGHVMATSPETLFQKLTEKALALCNAESAGISIVEDFEGKTVFRWRATAGAFAPLVGSRLPREFSPSGAVLDRESLLMMKLPARHYPYIADISPVVHEVMLAPFRYHGRAIGTLWIVSHHAENWFDAEDARIATSLAQFAAAAWQSQNQRAEAEETLRQLREREKENNQITSRFQRLSAIHETVLSAAEDFAYVFDLQGRFLYANRPLLELYGRTFDQVIGKTFVELGYPTWTAELHLREIAQVTATGAPIHGEIPFTGADGIPRVYDYIFTPVFGSGGTVEAVAGTTRDTTERKRGEDRDRMLIALDDVTRPLTDPQAITQACARMLGEHLNVNRCAYADVEEDQNTFNLTGDFNRDVPSIVGRYRFDQFGAECLRLMREDEPYIVSDAETDPRTAEVREAYRATRIRSVICVPLKKSGRFVAGMAVHQITPRQWQQWEVELVRMVASRCWESIERTRMVRVLAESEQRMRLAVKTSRLGVWELDLATQALTASEQCKANYGMPPNAHFPFTALVESVHPDDRRRVKATLSRSIEDREEFETECRILWPDESIHWILLRGQTAPTADGKPARMLGANLDITARKEAESEQVRLREEAVRASKAKDDFLATLSHELRTPLNPVLLLASEAARDPNVPAEARASFEVIRQNVELEARLIDDLLDLTTIVRGKLTIKKEPQHVHAILGDAVKAVSSDFEQKAIKLTVNLRAEKDRVFADPVRLLQIFVNLLKNAAKFTPNGGTVELETMAERGDAIAIQLSDTGIGMTSQEILRVFAPFEQGDHASDGARRFGGLGLGLAISQQLVEQHGGSIEATSLGRNRGTTFIVRLPPHASTNPETSDSRAPLPPAMDASTSRKAVRVLLVEDHVPTRNALEQLLRRRDFTVTTADSLRAARDLAERHRFDLVLSDLGLPDGDGTVLMTELRDRFNLRGIALTGYGMAEDIARCQVAGFITHLTKPIRVEALDAALREFSRQANP